MAVSMDLRAMHHRLRSFGSFLHMCFSVRTSNLAEVICIDPIAPDADFIGHNHTLASRRSVFWTPSLAGPDFCAGGFKWVRHQL